MTPTEIHIEALMEKIETLTAKVKRYEELIESAVKFIINKDTYIEARNGYNGRKWAVCSNGLVLGKDGEWDYEPMPSERTEEFLQRCRFDSVELARAALNKTGEGEV